jgi:hypothetical protein
MTAHGDAREGSEGETYEWSGWPVLFTLLRNMVYPALLPLMRTRRLPVVDRTDAPADLNKLVRFAERRNLVSARVPSHFKRSLPRHGASLGCGWRNGLQYGGYLRIYWISSSGQPTRGGPPAWFLGEVLTNPHCKRVSCYEMCTRASDLDCYSGTT